MSEPVVAVFIDPDAPLGPLSFLTKKVANPDGSKSIVIDCAKVEMADTGFLRLVPVPENLGGATMGVFVPPSYVLFMLQGEVKKKYGF